MGRFKRFFKRAGKRAKHNIKTKGIDSLVDCERCGKLSSTFFDICPHCGKSKKRKRIVKALTRVGSFLFRLFGR